MKTERKLKSIKIGIEPFMEIKKIQTELIEFNDYHHVSMESVVVFLLQQYRAEPSNDNEEDLPY
jgi:hypothetical protein